MYDLYLELRFGRVTPEGAKPACIWGREIPPQRVSASRFVQDTREQWRARLIERVTEAIDKLIADHEDDPTLERAWARIYELEARVRELTPKEP
jgi:hypothetical protein